MNILFDTNVILDVLLDREPFSEDSSELLSRAERGEIAGFATATTITTIHYLCSRVGDGSKAKRQIGSLLSVLEVATVNRSVIEAALSSRLADFEDAVLTEAGRLVPVEAIATRNKRDFSLAGLPAYTPTELINLLDSD